MLHLDQDDHLLSSAELRQVKRLCAPAALAARGIELQHGATGSSAEVPIDAPVLAAIRARLLARIGLPDAVVDTLRLRDCRRGHGHPPHHDDYVIAGRWLVATGVIYLDACDGGCTRFPTAGSTLQPLPGRAAWWLNLNPNGHVEPAALHDMEPVRAGRRRALFLFAYATVEETAAAARRAAAHVGPRPLIAALAAMDATRWPVPRTLHLVVDRGLPDESVALLQAAASSRRISVELHSPRDARSTRPVPVGDLLFCPSTTAAAAQLERRLWQPGVASFHRLPRGPFAEVIDALTLFTTLGLPVPRSETLHWIDRDTVAAAVERLGGLPIVLKLNGGEGGAGVMRLDSVTSLLSVLEGFDLKGIAPLLQTHVADAEHWRLVVVGTRVVAAYRNPQRSDGFRSHASEDPADYRLPSPPGSEALALAAADALQVALAGVDILVHASGRLYLLEANFPCYFPQAQRMADIDVAGAMIDHLCDVARVADHSGRGPA